MPNAVKKIPLSELRVGMFVHDLNTDWMSHPFIRSRFLIRDDEQLQKVVELGMRELYIDPSRGLDVPDAPTREEVVRDLDRQLNDIVTAVDESPRRSSVAGEMQRARNLHKEAHGIVRNVLQGVRLGQKPDVNQLEELVDRISESLLSNSGALLSLCQIRSVDEYTYLHSLSVGALIVAFCTHLQLPQDLVRQAGVGGLVHDIGKMKTPLSVLNKPARLSDAEFAIMKRHPGDGHDILADTPGIREVQLHITVQHHERLDGGGYPRSLCAEQIELVAKIAAIADVYDALTAERCYHQAMRPTEVLRRLLEWSGSGFDRELVHQFVRCVGIYPVGSAVQLESGLIGVVAESNEQDSLRPLIVVFRDGKRDCEVDPWRLDLGAPLGNGGGDRIVTSVDPRVWSIDPRRFL